MSLNERTKSSRILAEHLRMCFFELSSQKASPVITRGEACDIINDDGEQGFDGLSGALSQPGQARLREVRAGGLWAGSDTIRPNPQPEDTYMDRTVKSLLAIIAASLFMLNLQLAGVSLAKEAHAEVSYSDTKMITGALDGIALAIQGIQCN